MTGRYLHGLLLMCFLLLPAAYNVSADLPERPFRNPISLAPTCPVSVKVGRNCGLADITLQRNLTLQLNPNQPMMSAEIKGHERLYKASIDGTMIKLVACDAFEDHCTMLEEGGTKGRDLLTVNQYNRIEVKIVNGEVTIDINMQTNVMRKKMSMATGGGGGDGGGFFTFVVPPSNPSYRADVKILCDGESGKAHPRAHPDLFVDPTIPEYDYDTNCNTEDLMGLETKTLSSSSTSMPRYLTICIVLVICTLTAITVGLIIFIIKKRRSNRTMLELYTQFQNQMTQQQQQPRRNENDYQLS